MRPAQRDQAGLLNAYLLATAEVLPKKAGEREEAVR